MATTIKKMCMAGVIGIVLTVIVACGGATSDGTSDQTADTGSIALKIVFDANSHQHGKAFASCRDINTVTAQVFDSAGNELSTIHRWSCDARQGTITGVKKGIDRQVIVRGVWDNDGQETLFYEGRSPKFAVQGGDPARVTVNVDFVPDFPNLDQTQLEQLHYLADQDDDNYTRSDGDCDDHNPNRHPNADEICNGEDDNCNGMADEPYKTFYWDADGDHYGTESRTIQGCTVPLGYAEQAADCDDTNPNIHPGADEIECDNLDNDCDGHKSCNNPDGTFYRDADGDGFGDQSISVQGFQEGYVPDNTDCDDTKAEVKPGATETCNNIDDDCDGDIDENLLNAYHPDADKDGYGDSHESTYACTAPADYLLDGSDCNDGDGNIHPKMPEQCNGIDDNCDGEIDEGMSTVTYYADLDGDGFGDPDREKTACTAPTGYVENSQDCDDTKGYVKPGIEEVCNEIDDNCDGRIDEGCPWNKIFYDIEQSNAQSVIPGNNGGYVMAGDADDNALVIKIDKNGNALWNQTYGDTYEQNITSIAPGNDGGYVITGVISNSDTLYSDALIIKIDENGSELWTKLFGATALDAAVSILPDNAGGYTIAGNTRKSYLVSSWESWVFKIDENGNQTTSNQTIGNRTAAYSAISANSGGYVIAGEIYPIGGGYSNAWVIKIDKDGNEQWTKTFGGSDGDGAYSITHSNTGGYIIVGYTIPDGADYSDLWVIKIDEDGNETWTRTFGGSGSEKATSITPGNNGGYVITGWTYSYGAGNSDAWVIKIDEDGNEQWAQTFGSTGSDDASSITPGNNGGYVIVGSTELPSDDPLAFDYGIMAIKIDENGNAPATP